MQRAYLIDIHQESLLLANFLAAQNLYILLMVMTFVSDLVPFACSHNDLQSHSEMEEKSLQL
ncbi:hypothetical protein D0N87_30305, partial [Pseudomonas sp. ATCC 13867]